MQKPVLLFDADDVLENLLECWVRLLNERYGTNVDTEDVTSWDVAEAFPTLTREQVYELLSEDHLWESLSPTPGSQKILKKLHEEGFEIYVVTATDYRTCRVKFDRIKEMFPTLDDQHLIVTHNKQMVIGDILVDDKPENLIGGTYYGILVDRPHNRRFDAEAAGFVRVHNFSEIYTAIKHRAIQFEYISKKE